MVCTNRRANLSKLSRIKLLSIWTNPNHGRIGFIRSHISLPFMCIMFPRCFFCSAYNITIYVHCRWRSYSWSSPSFPQVRYHKPHPCSFIFFENVWWWRVRYKIWICFLFDFWYLLMFGGLLRFPLDHECAFLLYFTAKFGHLGCFFLS